MHRVIQSSFGEYSIKTNINIEEILDICNSENTITFIDENVNNHWPQFYGTHSIVVSANENVKTLKGVGHILDKIVSLGINKKTKIVAIGGGIIQDTIGFIASIMFRGMEYTLVPTTVLSQIDSCVGGKTSINHINKNVLGTFWPPKNILICSDFLKTLDELNYWSGWGEWIKYKILQNNFEEIHKTIDVSLIDNECEVIEDGLSYKIDIVERDEFDIGDRKFLNFGHTFGHALESISDWKIPHGYAVFIGCMISIIVSEKYHNKSLIDRDFMKKISRTYFNLGKIKDHVRFEKEWFGMNLIDIAKKSDKKQTDNDGLNMILLNDGKPILKKITDEKLLIESMEIVYNEICF